MFDDDLMLGESLVHDDSGDGVHRGILTGLISSGWRGGLVANHARLMSKAINKVRMQASSFITRCDILVTRDTTLAELFEGPHQSVRYRLVRATFSWNFGGLFPPRHSR